MINYDLIVIGAGVAGCEAAERAKSFGLRVALMEKNKVGGTCLNCGCIPSKSYLSYAHSIDLLKGININTPLDMDNLFEQMQIKTEKTIDILRSEKVKSIENRKIDLLFGKATIEQVGSTLLVKQNSSVYQAEKILVATGSIPKIDCAREIRTEIASGFALTNENIFNLKKRPKRLVIIGGGVSGVEMAEVFASYETEVTILESDQDILKGFDNDIVRGIRSVLISKGVKIRTNVVVDEVCEGTVFFHNNEIKEKIDCENVYLSMGRQPEKNEMFVCDTGGFIRVSKDYETEVENVYSIGDAIGGTLVAHKAIDDAISFVFGTYEPYYRIHKKECIPSVIYTSPECVQMGVCSEGASDNHKKVILEKLSMAYSGRFALLNSKKKGPGFIKMYFDEDQRVVGCAAMSHFASEYSGLLNTIIVNKMRYEEVLDCIYAHPTEHELIKECILNYVEKYVRGRKNG